MSNSLWPPWTAAHQSSLSFTSLRVCSTSCLLSQWWCLTISSSVVPFSFWSQSFPVTRSFPMSQLFTLGSQSIRASGSVPQVNIQGWLTLVLTGLMLLLSKALKSLLRHHSSKASILWCSIFFMDQLSHLYMTIKKPSVQFIRLVISSSLHPMDCSTPGFPVHHQLPEPAHTHVHWVSDAIQPSHLLPSPSPAFNLS